MVVVFDGPLGVEAERSTGVWTSSPDVGDAAELFLAPLFEQAASLAAGAQFGR
jgi:hypothetical protein